MIKREQRLQGRGEGGGGSLSLYPVMVGCEAGRSSSPSLGEKRRGRRWRRAVRQGSPVMEDYGELKIRKRVFSSLLNEFLWIPFYYLYSVEKKCEICRNHLLDHVAGVYSEM